MTQLMTIISAAGKNTQKLGDMYQELTFDPLGNMGANKIWKTTLQNSHNLIH